MPPSIYRPPKSTKLSTSTLSKRFAILKLAEDALVSRIGKHITYPYGFKNLILYKEIRWSVLQHYQVCDTPLLDITPNLDVALSFALTWSGKGVLNVIGVPNRYSAFDHDMVEQMVFLRLDSLLPPYALRSYFQNACLIGTSPTIGHNNSMKYDVARRLLATIEIRRSEFKKTGFIPKSQDYLYPLRDRFYRICKAVKREIGT